MTIRTLLATAAAVLTLAAPGAQAQTQTAGAPSPACQAALAYSAARRGAAVLVLKDGRPICEGYAGVGGPDHGMEIASGTKSFTGMMAAAAVKDGLLTLDEPVARTLPEWREDPAKARVTIRQLLNLTSGLESHPLRPPPYAQAVSLPLVDPPGTAFHYGAAPFQLFGEVMRRKLEAAGQPGDPYLYLKRRILDPIGLAPERWRRLPNGDALLPQGAVLSVREWAKFGELVRAGGVWKGRALVDRQAFRELFVGSAANPAYGVSWWLPHATGTPDPVIQASDLPEHAASLPADLVMAAGAGDQRLYVIPSQGLTITRIASIDLSALRQRRRGGGASGDGWSDAAFLAFFVH